MRTTLAIFVITCCVALAAAGTAVAESPTQNAYGGILGQQYGSIHGQRASSPGGSSGGDSGAAAAAAQANTTLTKGGKGLPFTGLDLALIALLGAGLVSTGIVLRRAGGPGSPA